MRSYRLSGFCSSRLVLYLLIAAAYIAGFLFGSHPGDRTPQPAPLLRVDDDDDLDFGEAFVQERFELTLPISNPTDRPITVKEVQTKCVCTSVEPAKFTVGPHKTFPLKVVLDLRKEAPAAGERSRPFATSLAAICENNEAAFVWQLTGRTKNFVVVSPPAVYLGERSVLAGPFPETKVSVKFLVPVSSVSVASTSDELRAEVLESDAPGQYDIVIRPLRESVGTVEGEIRVTAVARDGSVPPPVSITVRGHLSHDVFATPALVNFGMRKLEDRPQATVKLKGLQFHNFEVVEISTEKGIGVEASPTDKNEFLISTHVTESGFHKSGVTFSIRDGTSDDTKTYELVVPIRYIGHERN